MRMGFDKSFALTNIDSAREKESHPDWPEFRALAMVAPDPKSPSEGLACFPSTVPIPRLTSNAGDRPLQKKMVCGLRRPGGAGSHPFTAAYRMVSTVFALPYHFFDPSIGISLSRFLAFLLSCHISLLITPRSYPGLDVCSDPASAGMHPFQNVKALSRV
ncbi:hypothetical protein CDAR_479941 [Caerostris darwini]|uniref:Uncharacterized protein n=1 Tax=Caerostris darwini TaxID=1538125 RepID=A0AAV4T578_9ARAC|nr:hypothetical protein CDAR_479941 [Caerostris darwini]